MELLAKCCGSVAGIAGVSSVVGIPVGVKYMGQGEGHQVIGKKSSTISLETCNSGASKDQLAEINFGDTNSKSICGKGTDDSFASSDNSEFTSFFQESGDQTDNEGNLYSRNRGTNQCLGDTGKEGGVITSSDSGTNNPYLGLCEKFNKEVTKFIKKEKKTTTQNGEESVTLGTCSNDCGNSKETVDKTKTFSGEKTSNGKQVKFYKNEKLLLK